MSVSKPKTVGVEEKKESTLALQPIEQCQSSKIIDVEYSLSPAVSTRQSAEI